MAAPMIKQIGNYRLQDLLGEGAYAEVYRGQHVHLHTYVAIKILRTQLEADDIIRFEQEACLIARLNHLNIVRLLDYGVENGHSYLIMDEACGSLREKMPPGVPLSLEQLVIYIKQIASALQYIHNQGLIHRDIKPQNILLNHKGEALISDFGIAVHQQLVLAQPEDVARGSTSYMAPEQWEGMPEPASDQYALGVVVYEWLTGRRPFEGSQQTVQIKHLSVPPPLMRMTVPTLTPKVEMVVMRALSKRPSARYEQIQEFATELEDAQLSISARAIHVSRDPASSSFSAKPVIPAALSLPSNPRLPAISPALVKSTTPAAHSLLSNPLLPAISPSAAKPGIPSTPSRPPLHASSSTAAKFEGFTDEAQSHTPLAHNLPTYLIPTSTQPLISDTPAPPSRSAATISTRIASPIPHPHNRPFSRRKALMVLGGVVLVGMVGGGTWLVSRFLTPQHTRIAPTPSVPNSQPLFTHQQQELVTCVACSPKGTFIAAGGGNADHSIEVWDAHSHTQGTLYAGPFNRVNTVAWSPGEQFIAIASDDGKVYAWDIISRQQTLRRHYTDKPGNDNKMKSVAWSQNNLLAASGDNGTIKVFKEQGGQIVDSTRPPIIPGQSIGDVDSITWSPDGQYLAFSTINNANENTVQVWSFSNQPTKVNTFLGHNASKITGVIWMARRQAIISSSEDGFVKIWDPLKSISVVADITTHGHRVSAIALNPDETALACYLGNDGVVQVYDFTGTMVWKYPSQGWVESMCWLTDSKRLAIAVHNHRNDAGNGHTDGRVEVWQVLN
ncbi:MAG TPA: protein kinase [Ktedonosporobacter sp.]|nr:protein kinase [Ktedonosporobacter sp.]